MSSTGPEVVLIAAADEAAGIGYQGRLPWPKLRGDTERMRRRICNHPVLVGRKTFDRAERHLPGWPVYKLSRGGQYTSLAEVLQHHDAHYSGELLWVAGGAQVYALAWPLAERVELTRVRGTFPADCYLPMGLPPWPGWTLTRTEYEPGCESHWYETWERV